MIAVGGFGKHGCVRGRDIVNVSQISPPTMFTVVSIQVGRPATFGGHEPWVTSIFKTTVSAPLMLDWLDLAGDEQADLSVHGGRDKAVCVYSADHFPFWQSRLGRPDLGPGAFGENFTVTGLVEQTICLGDVFTIGEAVVQVSQPRSPCWKLGRKWARLDVPKLVLREGRTGWYFRVLQPGMVAPGQALALTERPYASWTIAAVNRLAYAKKRDGLQDERRALAECPALAESWRAALRE
jgi:MOSC domain-containing protein YiiM